MGLYHEMKLAYRRENLSARLDTVICLRRGILELARGRILWHHTKLKTRKRAVQRTHL